MTILPELEAQILRYYHVEKWRTGTIAAQLGVHHGTVTRVLTQAGLPQLGAPRRASAIDPCHKKVKTPNIIYFQVYTLHEILLFLKLKNRL